MKSKKPAKPRPRLPYRNQVVTRQTTNEQHSYRQHDYVCSVCGRVTRGPHRGEFVTNPKRRSVYKGCNISHGLCAEHGRRPIEQAKRRKGK